MLQASRLWLFGAMFRRSYTTSTVHPQPELNQIPIWRSHAISTLRPEKLVHSDFLVFVGSKRIPLHTKLPLHSLAAETDQRQLTRLSYAKKGLGGGGGGGGATAAASDTLKKEKFVRVPFPSHAQGFLYLHQPQPESGLSRSASSMRLRCTPSLAEASSAHFASLGSSMKSTSHSEPFALPLLPPSFTNTEIYEAFKTGYDLTRPDDTPWSILVVLIAGRPSLQYIRMQLLKDELFSESELQEYEEIYKTTNLKQGSHVLYPE